MGLDMYLYGVNYISKYDEESNKTKEILTEEIYWRKVNCVHKWFVDNCQEGNDDCRFSYGFDKETLEELMDICKRILDDHSLAEKLLPVEDGFFFGSTEYDEWYFEDIKYSYENLKRVLDELDKTNYEYFYYRSSW